ncbi:DUF4865 family protein [uncultured Cohaesibacter sp.]|uniref:DUF4865 family protein n=1 Tax=uncultured Cohaesibacter sp. TaxID=1002546 RepID=UPI0029C8809E|nr:DUF4865 family protein [uncultured Cohaesibacter sp.]
MIAMQYSFCLPADYDMARIDERIETKGSALDGFPHLNFKAYLTARKQDDGPLASRQNLYAPFYLWDEAEGATDFLSHAGFAAVSEAFGRPNFDIWLPLAQAGLDDVAKARFATRKISNLAFDADIATLRHERERAVKQMMAEGALAAFAGLDPSGWRHVTFALWDAEPLKQDAAIQAYRVGYVAR